ncbi:MAG: SDR family NAD(P)-dependent oxidoreductase [Salaquimonas sp.]
MLERFASAGEPLRVIVIGSSGGIGQAVVRKLISSEQIDKVFCLSRNGRDGSHQKIQSVKMDLTDSHSIENAASIVQERGEIDLVIIASGILHDETVAPEKDWKQMDGASMAKVFAVNTIGPALAMARFGDLLPRDRPSMMIAISARVGSISDNRMGGWYSYRASKAALNQIIKTYSIELKRKRKQAIVLGFHPGTVSTDLSEPFQSNSHERFTPEQCADYLLNVINTASAEESGNVLDWAGKTVPA